MENLSDIKRFSEEMRGTLDLKERAVGEMLHILGDPLTANVRFKLDDFDAIVLLFSIQILKEPLWNWLISLAKQVYKSRDIAMFSILQCSVFELLTEDPFDEWFISRLLHCAGDEETMWVIFAAYHNKGTLLIEHFEWYTQIQFSQFVAK